jgi:glucose/mannose-6-phosphate isomerase
MKHLDDMTHYIKFDTKGMGKAVAGMPEDVAKGVQDAEAFELPEEFKTVTSIVFTGMGGSALVGDLLRILMATESRIPVIVCRDYYLPRFVDDRCLVIASSFSGGTAETISAFEDGVNKKAKIMSFSHGGELFELARSRGFPAFHIGYEGLPRAALGYTLSALVRFMGKLGFVPDKEQELAEAVQVMQDWQEKINVEVPASRNEAKTLAEKMHGKAVAVYAANTLAGAARRWKQQLNENAKQVAFYGAVPEMNHNMLLGLEFPKQYVHGLMWVMLESHLDYPKNRKRLEATVETGKNSGVEGVLVEGRGDSALSQVFSVIHFGDYVSYYLGMLNETDPSDLSAVKDFKVRMQA